MTRPLNPGQQAQHRAFLAELARTGNTRAAAARLGLNRATLLKRRAKHPAFAADWDAALALAHATLQNPSGHGEGDHAQHGGGGSPHPKRIPEPQLIRQRSGHLQLRAKPAGRLTRAAEQAFLAALSATANVRLSARAAGFTHSAFYQRARRHAGFAREAFLIAEHARRARGDPWLFGPADLPPLPALDQVTGWSKADPAKAPTDETRALFGGWRLGDIAKRS